MTRNVPKFDSFKPREHAEKLPSIAQRSPVAHDDSSNIDEISRERRVLARRSHHGKRKNGWIEGSYGKERHSSPRNDGSSLKSSKLINDIGTRHFAEHAGASEQTLHTASNYKTDRYGDKGILEFGVNDKASIPFYRTSIIDALGASKERYYSGRSPLALLTRKEFALLQRSTGFVSGHRDSNFILGADEQLAKPNSLADNDDFVSLRLSKKTKYTEIESNPADPLSCRPRRRPRSRSHSRSASSSSSEGEDDVGTEQGDTMRAAQNENARLAALVRQEPANSQAWVQYIDYQEVWLRTASISQLECSDKKSSRGIADVKLSMYSKALASSKNDDNSREKLLLGMMEAAEKVLETGKLESKWREVVRDNRDCLKLRLAYLDFLQGSSASFRVPTYQDLAKQCNQVLAALAPAEKSLNHFAHCIYIFLRYSRCMHEAGYVELAVGLWQAMLQLNFPRDTTFNGDLDKQLDDLEEYWDNEKPRCGECFVTFSDKGELRSMGLTNEIHNDHSTKSSSIPNYAAGEYQHRSQNLWPGRATDESDTGDLYHVVLFSDVRPFLFIVPEQAHTLLTNAFLCFHSLPPLHGITEPDIQHWWQDPYLHSGIPDASIGCYAEDVLRQLTTSYSRTTNEMLWQLPTLTNGYLASATANPDTNIPFAINSLSHILSTAPSNTNLASYLVALSHSVSPSQARSLTKALLKSCPTSISLYLTLAHLEYAQHNPDRAVLILSTAIANFTRASEPYAVLPLWHAWLQHELQAGRLPFAQRVAASVGRISLVAAVDAPHLQQHIPYVLQTLHAAVTHQATTRDTYTHATTLDLLALICYTCTSASASPSLDAALSSYATSLNLLEPTSPTSELLHQYRAALITNHTTHHLAFNPREVRPILAHSAALFPANTALLAAHAAQEARFRIDIDRVRSVAAAALGRPADARGAQHYGNGDDGSGGATAAAWRVRQEIQRFATADLGGSTAHAVRAAFERELRARHGGRDGALWRAYIAFELSLLASAPAAGLRGSKGTAAAARPNGGRAKQVWLRGVDARPWDKEMVLRGLARADALGVSEPEARAVMDGCLDRGLRMFMEY